MTISHTVPTIVKSNSVQAVSQWETGANIQAIFGKGANGTLHIYFSVPTALSWGPNGTAIQYGVNIPKVHQIVYMQSYDFVPQGTNVIAQFGINFAGTIPQVVVLFIPDALTIPVLPFPVPTQTPTPIPTPTPAPNPTPGTIPNIDVPAAALQITLATNLLQPNNYTKTFLNKHVQDFYTLWKQTYLKTYNNGVYILYKNNSPEVTVSEAHGYLMLFAVSLNDKTIFDQAVNYYLQFRNANYQMNWQQQKNGNVISTAIDSIDSATDGDMDIIYALYLAHYRWGSTGTIKYLTLARQGLYGFSQHLINKTLFSLKLGDWATTDNSGLGLVTRSSDFMLGHLKVFALVDPGNAELWNKVRTTILNICSTIYAKNAPNTGLLPDFIQYANNSWSPPPGQVLEAPTDPDYAWNACRIYLRLATDAFNGNMDGGLFNMINKANSFIKQASQSDPKKIYAVYKLNGTTPNNYTDLAFQAPFMLSAAVSNDQAWLNTLYDYIVKEPIQDYYGDSVKLLSLLLITGNYVTLK